MNLKQGRLRKSDEYWQKEADKFYSLYSTKKLLSLPTRIFLNKRMAIILRYIKADKNAVALDVGCGSGEFASMLADYYKKVIGVDYSQIMIDKAKQNTKGNIVYYKADCSRVPVDANSVDYIFALGLMDYINNLDEVLGEFVRAIKNKGRMVITIPKTPSIFEFFRWSSIIRKRLFNMPPLVNILSRRKLYLILEKHGIKVLELASLWTTMWIVYAEVSKDESLVK